MELKDKFGQVSYTYFVQTLRGVQNSYKMIREATTPWNQISNDEGTRYYLTKAGHMGFAISKDGELTSVYSAIKGKGDILMKEAIKRGASHLDCFDGYLPKFYNRHGFVETGREANWTAGEPDVIFMERV
jgi:hypothetical protein